MTIQISKTEISKIVRKIQPIQLSRINQLVLFVGHAHSGHSIIGSILDAHNDIALANEVNIVKLIHEYQLTQVEIESILLHYSLLNGDSNSWHNSEYVYKIKNSLQGKTKNPTIIGDKKAGGTTRIFYNNPQLLNKIMQIYGDELKFVFVERNPVDIVAAYSYYMKQPPSQFHVDRFNENLNTVKLIQSTVQDHQFLKIKQEKFIKQPYEVVVKLLEFLNINYEPSQIDKWVKNVRADIPGKSSQIEIPAKLLVQL
ncbi:MAG: sulfotransferase [Marinicellaceae bacterium]